MKLQCHCGNVKLETAYSPENLTACNCSLCYRYGTYWGYFAPEAVTVNCELPTQTYRWGDGMLAFHHCPVCGCQTHYVTTEKVDTSKVGVNFRLAGAQALQGITLRFLDGADTWQCLSEEPIGALR